MDSFKSSTLSRPEKRQGQTCKDSFWVVFHHYCTEQQVCLSHQHRERPINHWPSLLTTQRENLMLDYSRRCKYKPLALFLPLLLHYDYFFCIENCLHSCGNLMDVWCLRLESIPSQNTDSLYVQLSHAIPVWMTLDPGAAPPLCDVHMQCLLFVTTGVWRLLCVAIYELKNISWNDTKSLEERRVALVSIPSCLYPIQWTFWKLPLFIAVLHSEWYECVCDCSFKFQLLFSRCDAFGQANGKSLLGFLMLFRWLSLFLFSCFVLGFFFQRIFVL